MAEKEVEEIERRIAEAEERLRIERVMASVSASARTSAETTEERGGERSSQLNRLVEAKRELKLLTNKYTNKTKTRHGIAKTRSIIARKCNVDFARWTNSYNFAG